MQIVNGVYVPVELDWDAVKEKIDAEVAHDAEFKFFSDLRAQIGG